MSDILMPKATAVWLVDNSSLTFEQIADFCGLHPLEVKGIADDEVARDIRGADPISNGQLTREELDAAQANPELSDEGPEEPSRRTAEADQEVAPLHARVTPPGSSRRHRLVRPQPSRRSPTP